MARNVRGHRSLLKKQRNYVKRHAEDILLRTKILKQEESAPEVQFALI
jgi:hypothetical protein